MKITLNIDSKSYTDKPSKPEMGSIRNRLGNPSSIKEIEATELKEIINRGICITPAEIEGRSGEGWKSQQLIVADIDNEVSPEEQLTSERALSICKANNISPFIMYHTFSSSPELERYRIIILLEEKLVEDEEAKLFTKRLTDLFNKAVPKSADTTMADNARIILGSREGSVFFTNNKAVPLDVMRALPKSQAEIEEEEKEAERRKKAAERAKRKPYTDNYQDLLDMRQRDIKDFDIDGYLTGELGLKTHKVGQTIFYNPCPICGHTDDFNTDKSGSLWYCHGKGGDMGGNIIDLLKHSEQLTDQEAMIRFNHLMGYDPIEWERAWKENIKQNRQPREPKEPPHEEVFDTAQEEPAEPKISEEEYRKLYSSKGRIADLFREIKETEEAPPISSGFKALDKELNGGFQKGLYCIGAISSLGKTTFALQVADHIAESGHDVLIFSLEMSNVELMARTISRETTKKIMADKSKPNYFIMTQSIMNGHTQRSLKDEERDLILEATDKYLTYAGNIFIKNEMGMIGTDYIRKTIERHINITGKRPFVLVDYAQILKKKDNRMSDKQSMDVNVFELKDISNEFRIPILAVSSVNRTNYLTPIDFESFKESGGIEFTSDVVLGMQLSCLEETLFSTSSQTKIQEKRERINIEKKKDPREIQVVILKNRNGRTGEKIRYYYYTKGNLIEEIGLSANVPTY